MNAFKKWDRMKDKQVTRDYVNNFLHYEGLKCLTDGLTYYLEPEDPAKDHSLPNLSTAKENVVGRRVEVTLARLQEVDPGVKRSPRLTEYITQKSLKDCQYWEFFVEEVSQKYFIEALDFYPKKRKVIIDWEEGDSRDSEEEEEKERPASEDVSYMISPETQIIQTPKVRRVETREPKNNVLSLSKALRDFHIAFKFTAVFDTNHTFLVIDLAEKPLTFLCTNLILQLNDLRKNAEFHNVESGISGF